MLLVSGEGLLHARISSVIVKSEHHRSTPVTTVVHNSLSVTNSTRKYINVQLATKVKKRHMLIECVFSGCSLNCIVF